MTWKAIQISATNSVDRMVIFSLLLKKCDCLHEIERKNAYLMNGTHRKSGMVCDTLKIMIWSTPDYKRAKWWVDFMSPIYVDLLISAYLKNFCWEWSRCCVESILSILKPLRKKLQKIWIPHQIQLYDCVFNWWLLMLLVDLQLDTINFIYCSPYPLSVFYIIHIIVQIIKKLVYPKKVFYTLFNGKIVDSRENHGIPRHHHCKKIWYLFRPDIRSDCQPHLV